MRLKLSALIRAEAAAVLVLVLLGLAIPGIRSLAFFVASMTFILMVMHSAVLPFFGRAFVIYDAPPDSAVKYYFFAAIFASAFGARYLRDAAVAFAG